MAVIEVERPALHLLSVTLQATSATRSCFRASRVT